MRNATFYTLKPPSFNFRYNPYSYSITETLHKRHIEETSNQSHFETPSINFRYKPHSYYISDTLPERSRDETSLYYASYKRRVSKHIYAIHMSNIKIILKLKLCDIQINLYLHRKRTLYMYLYLMNHTTNRTCPLQKIFYSGFVVNIRILLSYFVIGSADKASNNYTFVCKRYYVSILVKELLWLHRILRIFLHWKCWATIHMFWLP